ncbi:hypothetical protein JCM11251_005732 [Rhodosporidiobolus azoricus]
MAPPSSRPKSPFPSLWISLLLLALGTTHHRTTASPEPAALAPRPPPPAHLNPNLLPPHLRQNQHPAAPLPEAIAAFRFNAPQQETVHKTQGVEDDVDDGFELSPLVLAVTVDGQVHALNRDTGQWKWTLHDDGGLAAGRRTRNRSDKAYGGPLVRSVSRRKKPATAGGASAGSGRANETGVVPAEPDEDDDNDETYIIEPSGSGDIYVYSRSTGGLDKLPLSMQELVALSPFRFPGHESRMFSASKHTRFVGVDLRTGRLVGVFGSNAGWCEWDETDELTGAKALDCEEDIEQRPEDLLYMARTEYELSIYDTTSALPLQVLSYTTYTSSTLPQPLTSSTGGAPYPSQSTWTRTPDSLYHQPMPDGALVCFRAGQSGVHWSLDFEAPVVSVFDVVVPPPSEPGDARQHPIMFEQPHPLLVPDLPLDFAVLQQEPAAAFVGRIDAAGEAGQGERGEKRSELFAMSRDRFPLVPFAQMAEAAKQNVNVPAAGLGGEEGKEDDSDGRKWHEAPDRCRGTDCIIGRHRLRNPPPPSPVHLDATLDPPPSSSSERLLIEAPPSSSDDPSPSSPHAHPAGTPNRRSPHYPGSSTLLASLYKSTARELRALGPQEAGGGKFTFGVLLLVLAAWIWTKGRGKKEGAAASGQKVRFVDKGRKGDKARSRRSSGEESVEDGSLPATPPDEQPLSGVLSAKQQAQAMAAASAKGHRKAGSTGSSAKGKGGLAPLTKQDGLRRRSPSTPPTPTSLGFSLAHPPAQNGTSAASSPARTRSSSLSLAPPLPIVPSQKELPPLPPSALDGEDPDDLDPSSSSSPPTLSRDSGFDDGAESDSPPASGGGDVDVATPPRKRNRRRRGAKKKKPKDPGLEDELVGAALGVGGGEGEKDSMLEGITLSERETRDEDDDSSSPPLGRSGGSAQVGLSGQGVDGEAVGAEAPLSTGITRGETPRKGKLDEQLVGGLAVSETIIGYGSHGTVVLRGEFQGRAVAVKRLLKDFVTIAAHEVNLLQESDDHPHVIRYFCKEQRETFLYIALELCPASLFDLIDQPAAFPELVGQLDPKKALKQITSGLRHLHSLKIVHRDIKPQNILVSTAKRGRGQGGLRMLISDFGLCKKLDVDESSFQQTVNHAAGSFGYRAPEVLRGLVDPNEAANGGAGPMSSIGSGGSNTTVAGSSSNSGSTDPSMRLTRSIDVFSLGCIFYYVLTRGEHPFGGRYEREMNILQGKVSLERLDGLGEEAVEVQDLITRMVATDPRERPAADNVLLHPFFWNSQKRLLFICDASDRFEIMERDPPSPTLVTLERRAREIVGDDWSKALDRTLLDNLGKYRKYDGASVRDLLRVLRNKKHHYQDLPETVRRNLGDLPGGFLSYFTTRFPHLLLHVYDTVATHLSDEAMFASTFRIPEDET